MGSEMCIRDRAREEGRLGEALAVGEGGLDAEAERVSAIEGRCSLGQAASTSREHARLEKGGHLEGAVLITWRVLALEERAAAVLRSLRRGSAS